MGYNPLFGKLSCATQLTSFEYRHSDTETCNLVYSTLPFCSLTVADATNSSFEHRGTNLTGQGVQRYLRKTCPPNLLLNCLRGAPNYPCDLVHVTYSSQTAGAYNTMLKTTCAYLEVTGCDGTAFIATYITNGYGGTGWS